MKQIASAYTYNKTSGVIVLSGLTIDRDQLLLVVNTTRNVTYYNFADSATTLQSYVIPSVYKGFYDGGALYNIGDIVQTNGNPYGTAGGFFIRLQAPNAGYAPAVGGGTNSHWAPTSASGATITLNASVVSSASSHNNADALTIYYDDQALGTKLASEYYDSSNGITLQRALLTVDSGDGSGDTLVVGQSINGNICPLPVKFGDYWEEPLNLKINIEPVFGQGAGGVGLLAVGGQSYTDPINIPPIHVVGTVTATPAQGTTVTNTNFTSITPSTSLVSAVAGRRVLSVFNEGAGLLYISGGGTCTTTSYQVRLGMGGYWECPAGQLALAHTAVFGTTGTAKVSQVT